MNKIIIILFWLILLSNHSIAYAARTFIVEKSSSDYILVTDGSSEYIIEHDYDCSDYDFVEGTNIYIDTSYSPSYGDTIIIPGYSNTICEVTSSKDVNIKQYYVDKVLDSDDKIIVTDKYGDQLLVEYGLGCGLSMWRYEGKNVDIDIGGSFLDGIGDQMYLFDSGRDCKIWDAEEIGSGKSYSGYTNSYPSTNNTTVSCPLNSHISSTDSSNCICDTGYKNNSTNDGCVPSKSNMQICQESFSINADWDGTKTSDGQLNCVCKIGYEWNIARTSCVLIQQCPDGYMKNIGNQCVTYTKNCQDVNNNDPYQVGVKGEDGKISCKCILGYDWDGSQCIKKIDVFNVQKSTPEIKTESTKIKISNSSFVNNSQKSVTATTSSSSTDSRYKNWYKVTQATTTTIKATSTDMWYQKLWKFIWRF